MLKWWMRLIWFLSSCTPAWVILALYHGSAHKGSIILPTIFIAATILSNCVVFSYLARYRKNSNGCITVELVDIKSYNTSCAEYIVLFAIMLFGLLLNTLTQAVGFAILVALFALIYIRCNKVAFNPMLYIFGYQVYDTSFVHTGLSRYSTGEFAKTEHRIVITKMKRCNIDGAMAVSCLHDDVYMEVVE